MFHYKSHLNTNFKAGHAQRIQRDAAKILIKYRQGYLFEKNLKYIVITDDKDKS